MLLYRSIKHATKNKGNINKRSCRVRIFAVS